MLDTIRTPPSMTPYFHQRYCNNHLSASQAYVLKPISSYCVSRKTCEWQFESDHLLSHNVRNVVSRARAFLGMKSSQATETGPPWCLSRYGIKRDCLSRYAIQAHNHCPNFCSLQFAVYATLDGSYCKLLLNCRLEAKLVGPCASLRTAWGRFKVFQTSLSPRPI